MTSSTPGSGNHPLDPDVAIVFIHGYMGYGEKKWLPDFLAFFRGVRSALSDLGVPLYFPQLPRGTSVKTHATVLADYIYRLPQKKIYLVGYSMGALHSRYMIHHLDPEHRIRKLTTVAGANRGTYIAEWALGTEGPVQWLARWLSYDALLDLTREAGERFGRELKNRDDVDYASYAGVRPFREIPLIFKFFAWKLRKVSGDNDWLVPLVSAKWLNFQRVLRTDHMEVIGWNFTLPWPGHKRPFDHRGLYREIVLNMI